jgi:hypothetical protein
MKKYRFVPAWFEHVMEKTHVPRPRWCPVWLDNITEDSRVVFIGAIVAIALIVYIILT